MTVTDHALQRINERITEMNRWEAASFTEKEIKCGDEHYTLQKDGKLLSKVITRGIVYIIDRSDLKVHILITVYLDTEKEHKEW